MDVFYLPLFLSAFFPKVSHRKGGGLSLSLSLSVSSPLRRTRRRTSLYLILSIPLSRSRWTKRAQHHQRFFKNGRLERQREKNTIIIIQTRGKKQWGWWFRRVARESGGEERARVERQGPAPGREHQLRHADDDSDSKRRNGFGARARRFDGDDGDGGAVEQSVRGGTSAIRRPGGGV